MGERDLLRWLRRHDAATTQLIGDDAALLPPASARAVTTDAQIEGVHFPRGLDPALLARRLLAVNLSDLAAMAARPVQAFLALSAPAAFDHRRFFAALTRGCRLYGLQLAGGDLARTDYVHAVMTLVGERPHRGRWLRRDRARPGDRLWVGGTLGESALGYRLLARAADRSVPSDSWLTTMQQRATDGLPPRLRSAAHRALQRHVLPVPQLQLGQWLGHRRRASGLDVSDGLGIDLARLCEASDVGVWLDLDAMPRPSGFDDLCTVLDVEPEGLVLGGGEDYVLLFTLAPGVRKPPFRHCRPIGEIVERPGDGPRMQMRTAAGGDRALDEASIPGWDHLS